MTPVSRQSVRFEFAAMGTQVEAGCGQQDRLCLDVGNRLEPGVICHHHLGAYLGSTTSLVLAHPELVAESVNPSRRPGDPFVIVLHQWPDLDCQAAAWLAISYLSSGGFAPGADEIARYVDGVDCGRVGLSRENPFAIYSACMILAHRLSQRQWSSREEMWRYQLGEAFRVLEFVGRQAEPPGISVSDVDAFACPGLFGHADRKEVLGDEMRYRQKLKDPRCHAQRARLRLPKQFGGVAEVDALLVRDVQNSEDPERVIFFKDWARSDKEQAPESRGFVGLCVFSTETPTRARRAILSVRPDAEVCLRGLGAALDREESAARVARHGVDDRALDPVTGQKKPPRVGYTNSDPWYDGRGHGFTIVDAPRGGTLLEADRIEQLFVEFGKRTASDAEPLEFPSLTEFSSAGQLDPDSLRQWSALAEQWGRQQEKPGAREWPEIFISYPRTQSEWVEKRLYAPLKRWRGEPRVFFDRTTIVPGLNWVQALASGVKGCRVFVAVYCPDYFRSEWCQYELQLAVTRDPTGKKRIIVPVMLQPVEPPDYCSLIQAFVSSERIEEEILRILKGLLPET